MHAVWGAREKVHALGREQDDAFVCWIAGLLLDCVCLGSVKWCQLSVSSGALAIAKALRGFSSPCLEATSCRTCTLSNTQSTLPDTEKVP